MKRSVRRGAMLLCVLLLALSCALPAFAQEAPDLGRNGSIRITMRRGETAVGGGTLTLYRVGAVQEENGTFRYALTGDFAGCGESLSDAGSPELAKRLAGYAAEQGFAGTTAEIGGDGNVSFADLQPGLYLLAQDKAAEGYHPAAPFLVSLPLYEGGAYVYDVDASPKVELSAADPGSSTPTAPTTPTTPTTPSTSTPGGGTPTLPQTGQLNWPVPVLVVLGLGLISVGWLLRKTERHAD